jgi:hypothetical protein
MPIRRGVVAASITELPTVTINAVTNFNQDRATFNATVSANYQSTIVKFQYNTTNNFASYTEVTATGSPVTGQSVAVYYNATGLSVGTTYYVRAVISNGIGTVTTASTSFATWSLKTYTRLIAGTENSAVYLQTITPTGGSAITPYIFNVFFLGGGGGGAGGGGGGGGCYFNNTSNISATSAVSSYLNVTVGGGGSAGNWNTNTNAGNGTNSTISGTSFSTLTATGGIGGIGTDGQASAGGASGSGTTSSYGGGTGSVTSTGSGKSLTYYFACGGGGGNYEVGANGHAAGNGYGGNGGVGGGFAGYFGGSGGGGYGSTANGTGNRIIFNLGTGVYGCGGGPNTAGTAGMCYFQYYGP